MCATDTLTGAIVLKPLTAFVMLCLLSGCGAYGTGLPNGDRIQMTYKVVLNAGGSSKAKWVSIQYYNVPGARTQRFEIGQFQTWDATLQSGQGIKITVHNRHTTDTVSCRIRTEPETEPVYTSDTHTARCYKRMP